MKVIGRARPAELLVSLVVPLGVAAAGVYDFENGNPPAAVIDLDRDLALALVLFACATAAGAAAAMVMSPPGRVRTGLRLALLAAAFVPILMADPTYSSLLVAVPLIDIRRCDPEPSRSVWTIGLLALVAWAVVTEESPRITAEYEAMIGLAIAFLIIVLFGDALRQVDRAVEAEATLASLRERSRLSEELHDSVGHHLLAASVQLRKADALRGQNDEESVRSVELAGQAVSDAMSETRLIVDATRSDRPFDLENAVRNLTRRLVPADTLLTVKVNGDHSTLDDRSKVALYRVTQEALSNIVRHAAATSAVITIDAGTDQIEAIIADNGRGFDVADLSGPGGVNNMRSNVEAVGGTFDITSADGGTSVRASVPA